MQKVSFISFFLKFFFIAFLLFKKAHFLIKGLPFGPTFFSFSTFLRTQAEPNINKVPSKKVLFLECIKLNGMSFGQKLLNATSKNYFSAVYFTSTSNFFFYFLILYFNMFFHPFNFFLSRSFFFLKECPFSFIIFFKEFYYLFITYIFNFNIV